MERARSLPKPAFQRSQSYVALVRKDAIAQVKALKAEEGKDIWLCGGGTLVSELFAAGLINSLILKVNPFVMGVGIPLFAEPVPLTQLILHDSQVYPGGIMVLRYDVIPKSNSI